MSPPLACGRMTRKERVIYMPTWLTMQNITFVIAVAGFLMSLATWVKDFVSQRKNLAGRILGIKSYANVTYMDLALENRSRLPIAITHFRLLLGEKIFDCAPLPTLVSAKEQRRGNELVKRTEEYSTALPIQLLSLGATNCLVLFERLPVLPPNDATHLTLLIGTNRGKEVRMTLPLPEGWASLRNFLPPHTS